MTFEIWEKQPEKNIGAKDGPTCYRTTIRWNWVILRKWFGAWFGMQLQLGSVDFKLQLYGLDLQTSAVFCRYRSKERPFTLAAVEVSTLMMLEVFYGHMTEEENEEKPMWERLVDACGYSILWRHIMKTIYNCPHLPKVFRGASTGLSWLHLHKHSLWHVP